jgi:hypothetical protein
VAEVIRRFEKQFAERFPGLYSPPIKDVLRDLAACRTAALGGHLERCDTCGYTRITYNSCRNRHCPSCLGTARSAWLARQQEDVLPVPYFHVVFTLPEALRGLALQNKPVLYNLLFRAASETLKQVARTPKHLGGEIGFLAVLHTWGQNLCHHPHVHCVVPAGGVARDGTKWIDCRRSRKNKIFFAPVRVMSKLFRGKFVHELKAARQRGDLQFHGALADLHDERAWQSFLNNTVRTDWVVYCKRPFGGPQQVLRYLARYTHRVAISDHRLKDVTDTTVTFSYKDYRDQDTTKTMTLDGEEFLRRFLLHVLPKGFMRIRYYGFLGNAVRAKQLDLIRGWLAPRHETARPDSQTESEQEPPGPANAEACRCPECGSGTVQRIELLSSVCVLVPKALSRAPPVPIG